MILKKCPKSIDENPQKKNQTLAHLPNLLKTAIFKTIKNDSAEVLSLLQNYFGRPLTYTSLPLLLKSSTETK